MKQDLEINLRQDNVVEQFNEYIAYCKDKGIIKENDISDGYHTFGELYEFRKLYNAALFNEWATENFHAMEAREGHNAMMGSNQKFRPKYDVHKSIRHNDGQPCFGGGWFIVVAVLPTGQISNHYKIEDWDLFQIPEYPIAKYEFDGHTPEDVMERLKNICNE